MKPVLLYTAARLAIFAATAAVLFLFGARGILLVLLALLISGLVSYVLLSTQRDAVSAKVTESARSRRQKFNEARSKEDA